MEITKETRSKFTQLAVERLAQLNRELFGEEVVIIDETGPTPHSIDYPEAPKKPTS